MGIIDLPPNYAWLAKEPGPKMLVEALKLHGIHEGVGQADNPVILQWAQKLGLKAYQHDDMAWCGLLMAFVALLANKPIPENPLWARNWAKWGVESKRPCLGDVLVFSGWVAVGMSLYMWVKMLPITIAWAVTNATRYV